LGPRAFNKHFDTVKVCASVVATVTAQTAAYAVSAVRRHS